MADPNSVRDPALDPGSSDQGLSGAMPGAQQQSQMTPSALAQSQLKGYANQGYANQGPTGGYQPAGPSLAPGGFSGGGIASTPNAAQTGQPDPNKLSVDYGTGAKPWNLYSAHGDQTPWSSAKYMPTSEGWRPLFQVPGANNAWSNYYLGNNASWFQPNGQAGAPPSGQPQAATMAQPSAQPSTASTGLQQPMLWPDASRGLGGKGDLIGAQVQTPVNMQDPAEVARWQQMYGQPTAQTSPVQGVGAPVNTPPGQATGTPSTTFVEPNPQPVPSQQPAPLGGMSAPVNQPAVTPTGPGQAVEASPNWPVPAGTLQVPSQQPDWWQNAQQYRLAQVGDIGPGNVGKVIGQDQGGYYGLGPSGLNYYAGYYFPLMAQNAAQWSQWQPGTGTQPPSSFPPSSGFGPGSGQTQPDLGTSITGLPPGWKASPDGTGVIGPDGTTMPWTDPRVQGLFAPSSTPAQSTPQAGGGSYKNASGVPASLIGLGAAGTALGLGSKVGGLFNMPPAQTPQTPMTTPSQPTIEPPAEVGMTPSGGTPPAPTTMEPGGMLPSPTGAEGQPPIALGDLRNAPPTENLTGPGVPGQPPTTSPATGTPEMPIDQRLLGSLGGAGALASGATNFANNQPLPGTIQTAAGIAQLVRSNPELIQAVSAATGIPVDQLSSIASGIGGAAGLIGGAYSLSQGNDSGIAGVVSGAGALGSSLVAAAPELAASLGVTIGGSAALTAVGGFIGAGFLARDLINLGLNEYKQGDISKAIMNAKQQYLWQYGNQAQAEALRTAPDFRSGLLTLSNAPQGTSGQVQFGVGNEYAGETLVGQAGSTTTPNWQSIVQRISNPDTIAQHPDLVAGFIKNLWVQTGPSGAAAYNPGATREYQSYLLSKLPYDPVWLAAKQQILNGETTDPRTPQGAGSSTGAPEIPVEPGFLRVNGMKIPVGQPLPGGLSPERFALTYTPWSAEGQPYVDQAIINSPWFRARSQKLYQDWTAQIPGPGPAGFEGAPLPAGYNPINMETYGRLQQNLGLTPQPPPDPNAAWAAMGMPGGWYTGYKHGGYIAAPPDAPVPTTVHGGEYVVPRGPLAEHLKSTLGPGPVRQDLASMRRPGYMAGGTIPQSVGPTDGPTPPVQAPPIQAPGRIPLKDYLAQRGLMPQETPPVQVAKHEQSETVETPDGQWQNVHGRRTDKPGQPLPTKHDFEEDTYPDETNASAAAVLRSKFHGMAEPAGRPGRK